MGIKWGHLIKKQMERSNNNNKSNIEENFGWILKGHSKDLLFCCCAVLYDIMMFKYHLVRIHKYITQRPEQFYAKAATEKDELIGCPQFRTKWLYTQVEQFFIIFFCYFWLLFVYYVQLACSFYTPYIIRVHNFVPLKCVCHLAWLGVISRSVLFLVERYSYTPIQARRGEDQASVVYMQHTLIRVLCIHSYDEYKRTNTTPHWLAENHKGQ